MSEEEGHSVKVVGNHWSVSYSLRRERSLGDDDNLQT